MDRPRTRCAAPSAPPNTCRHSTTPQSQSLVPTCAALRPHLSHHRRPRPVLGRNSRERRGAVSGRAWRGGGGSAAAWHRRRQLAARGLSCCCGAVSEGGQRLWLAALATLLARGGGDGHRLGLDGRRRQQRHAHVRTCGNAWGRRRQGMTQLPSILLTAARFPTGSRCSTASATLPRTQPAPPTRTAHAHHSHRSRHSHHSRHSRHSRHHHAPFSAPTSLVPSPHISTCRPTARSVFTTTSFCSGVTRA